MKIAVCVSHVPDTATQVKVGPDGKKIDESGVTFVINPYDEYAVEEALLQKEKHEGEVIVISVGTDAHKESMRKALAMGADSGVLLKYEGELDAYAAAKALSEEIKEGGYDLVFFGKQSVDYDNAVTGQLTAELLDMNSATVVVELSIDGTSVKAEREIEGGREIIETSLPCIITTQKGLNEPRYASLKGIMKAKKKKIEEKEAKIDAPKVEVTEMTLPPKKEAGKILEADENAAAELVRLLKEEAKVL